jgi:large subunit ribosomal protein L4
MLKVNLYSNKGTKLEAITLPKNFEEEINKSLLAQAVRTLTDSAHFGVSRTKTRADINKTKKKVYKQKGTGGARHGAKSAPIYVGGGVAHGKKLESRKLILPQKMAQKALKIAVSMKVKLGRLVAIKEIKALKKTKEGQILVNKILSDQGKKTKKITLVTAGSNVEISRVFRNLKDVTVIFQNNLNAERIYHGGLIIFDQDIFEVKKEKETKK